MRKANQLITYCLLYLGILLTNSFAGDSTKFSTDEISVYGYTGISTPAMLPAFVQIAEKDEIMTKNGSDLSDVLRLFSGVSVRDYGGLSTVSINGSNTEHTLILLDGIKLNSAQNNLFDASMLTKSKISRIEVLTGGMSSIYGSEAVGGVINIISDKAVNGAASFEIDGGVGSYGLKTYGLRGMKDFGKVRLLFNFSEETSDNNYEYYFSSGGKEILKSRQNSSYEQRDFSARMNLDLNTGSVITFSSAYLSAFRNIPGLETGSSPSNSFQKNDQWQNQLTYVSQLSQNIAFTGRVAYSNDLMNYSDDLIVNSFYKNIGVTSAGDVRFNFRNITGNAGFELNSYTMESNETVSLAERLQYAFYAGTDIVVSEELRIFPSVRVDNYSDLSRTSVTANMGVNLKPLSMLDLHLKARIGNNFSVPTFNELYWKTGGNTELEPERSLNYSAGIVYEASDLLNSTYEISFSRIVTSGKIVWTPQSSGYWTPVNLRESESEALTILVSAFQDLSKESRINADFSMNFASSRKTRQDFEGDPNVGKQLAYVPEFSAKAGISLSHKTFKAGLFYDHIGSRYMNPGNTRSLPYAGLLEANIQYTFPLSLFFITGRVEANNVLNENYQMIAGYPMPLRNFTFKLNLEYR